MAKSTEPNGVAMRSLHHIGVVVASIEKVGEQFAATMGATWDGVVIEDPLQGARVSFFDSGPDQPLIELVEPVGPKSPLVSFLQRGGGLHHLCYEVASLDEELERNLSHRAHIVRPPMPAVAFDGRRIAWVYTPNRMLIEYLEASAASVPSASDDSADEDPADAGLAEAGEGS
jgi:methylmalonyl-CoA/ethylmalonyl-CoA epimerase